MANTVIQIRNSTVTGNVPSSLANGEISINNRDGKFFYSTPAGSIVTHHPFLGPAGLNKEIQFNDSGTLGSNSGLAFDKASGSLNVSTSIIVSGINLGAYANAAFNTANAAFLAANAATATDTTQNNSITAAFLAANAATATDTTQNNSITAAFAAANAAFLAANSATTIDVTQNNSITAAFVRANNSINANTGGTITGNVIISANLTASNIASQSYVQFGDGTKQFTANAGSGGGSSSSITNGTSNVSVASSGNVTVTVGGTANVMTVSSVGTAITGTLSASGNVSFNQTIISISANTTAISYASYVLTASLTLTLPASPSVGNWINFTNRSGTTTSVIARNGSNIMGLAENMTLNSLNARATLAYTGASQGWVIMNE
jgi:hypothetical protein